MTTARRSRDLVEDAAVVLRDWAHLARILPRAAFDRTEPRALASGTRTPIVLLPGIWEPWRFLLPLARRLHALGHSVHPLPSLGWNGRTLDDSVARAHQDLADLRATGLEQAVLVAHSKGGLIGAHLLAQQEVDASPPHGELPHLLGLVAIASPFSGSALAVPALRGTPLGMFAPAGPDVRRIAEFTGITDRVVALDPAWDEMIPQGTRLPGATQVRLGVSGHFLPLDDHATAHLVHEHVERLARETSD